jgi:5'-3' exoribonuclease 1
MYIALTKNQRVIFDKVKTFIMENRGIVSLSASHYRSARLALPNEFPARDRAFITKLAEDLHLDVGWDEYDQDQNLVTWRFPRLSNHEVEQEKGEEEGEGGEEEVIIEQDGSTSNGEWEDEISGDDDEAHAAVDRVLKKYEKAPVVDLDAQGSFDERHQRSVKEKMDEWKRGYYQV